MEGNENENTTTMAEEKETVVEFVKKQITKMELDDKQVNDFLTTGRFTIERDYMNGKVKGIYSVYSGMELDEFAIKFGKEFDDQNNPPKEGSEEIKILEHNSKRLKYISSETEKRCIKAVAASTRNEVPNFHEGPLAAIMRNEYQEVRTIYYALLENGVYDPVAEQAMKNSIKK